MRCRARLTPRRGTASFTTLASGVGGYRYGEQVVEAVEVGGGAEANLDPVAARRLAVNGWIGAVTALRVRPPSAGNPQVDDSRPFEVSDLAVPDELCWLVSESRPTLVGVAGPEHGVDESVPERIRLIDGHAADRMRSFHVAYRRLERRWT